MSDKVPEKINVQCYKCQTIYELEPEMTGQLVECAVCNTIFLIPELTSIKELGILHTHPYVPNGNKASSEGELEETNLQTARNINVNLEDTSTTKLSTDTIKITKNTRGMIPQVEDDKFGLCKGHALKHQKTTEDILDSFKEADVKTTPEKQKPEEKTDEEPEKKASGWWHFGSHKNKH